MCWDKMLSEVRKFTIAAALYATHIADVLAVTVVFAVIHWLAKES